MSIDKDPWLIAWSKLKTLVDSGASQEEITIYAAELGAALPPDSPAARAQAMQYVITDILTTSGENHGQDRPLQH